MPPLRIPVPLIVIALTSLVACGQKGDLVLPQAAEPIAIPADDEEQDEEEDSSPAE